MSFNFFFIYTYCKLTTGVGIMLDLFWIRYESTDGGRVNDQFGLIELRGIGFGQRTAMMVAA